MLLIKNKLAPSSIHGLGLFAEEYIPSGSVIWKTIDGFDGKVSIESVESLPLVCRKYFEIYGWIENGKYNFCIDNQKYINHSDNPNCIVSDDGSVGIAGRDIEAGEEITEDYRSFDENFGKRDFGFDWT